MEGAFSFILFAVFFYLMMRFGCGAHMTHGHHGKEKHSKPTTTIDPVCGVNVAEDEGYGKLHDGTLFRFCSKKCLNKFDQDPQKYISQVSVNKNEEHHHGA